MLPNFKGDRCPEGWKTLNRNTTLALPTFADCLVVTASAGPSIDNIATDAGTSAAPFTNSLRFMIFLHK
jgi:hypothetical protein